MIKKIDFTGFCIKDQCTRTISIDYIFNGFEWEKGTGECPDFCNCECEILNSAPDELQL